MHVLDRFMSGFDPLIYKETDQHWFIWSKITQNALFFFTNSYQSSAILDRFV